MAAALLVAACGSGGGAGQSQNLASDQTLKFPVFGDFGTLDPAQLDAEVDSEIAQNVFNGPFKFDNNLQIQPDLASEVPTVGNGGISSDGLTYTIKLRKDVTFSNGDKFTSADVLYSWNRAVALQGPYASNLSAIDGFGSVASAVKNLKPKKADVKKDANVTQVYNRSIESMIESKDPKVTLKGLSAIDDYTVKVKLSAPAGWFLSAVALESATGMVVDKNAVAKSPRDWWQTPDTLVGTGAYKMTAYSSKQSVDFAAVPNWWGATKPIIKHVHLDMRDPGQASESTAIQQFEQGKYDIVGYGGYNVLPKEDILRIQRDSVEAAKLSIVPKVRTTWVTFNVNPKHPAGGPFTDANPKGKELRQAFALAVDKSALAKTVCSNITCAPATGGLITKGLKGYLGDGADPLGRFDATHARQLLKDADPSGSMVKGLKYSYNTGGTNDDVATFLQGQWQQNLGVKVDLDPQQDPAAFISDRQAGKFVMSRDGWQADYDHPQDWFDNQWGQQAEDSTADSSGYAPNASDKYNVLLNKADALPLDQALPVYREISKLISDDAVYIPLYYTTCQFLIQPWTKGAGSNNFFDHYWNEISLLQH